MIQRVCEPPSSRDFWVESFREAQLRENDGLHLTIPAGTYYVDVSALDNENIGEYAFEIVAGETGRDKIVSILDADSDAVHNKLLDQLSE